MTNDGVHDSGLPQLINDAAITTILGLVQWFGLMLLPTLGFTWRLTTRIALERRLDGVATAFPNCTSLSSGVHKV